MREKYARRIERFLNLVNYPKTIFFIRSGCSKEFAIKLRKTLLALFPKKNFVLVIINNDQNLAEPWLIDGIENYYVPKELLVFPGNYQKFGQIFDQLFMKYVCEKRNGSSGQIDEEIMSDEDVLNDRIYE